MNIFLYGMAALAGFYLLAFILQDLPDWVGVPVLLIFWLAILAGLFTFMPLISMALAGITILLLFIWIASVLPEKVKRFFSLFAKIYTCFILGFLALGGLAGLISLLIPLLS